VRNNRYLGRAPTGGLAYWLSNCKPVSATGVWKRAFICSQNTSANTGRGCRLGARYVPDLSAATASTIPSRDNIGNYTIVCNSLGFASFARAMSHSIWMVRGRVCRAGEVAG